MTGRRAGFCAGNDRPGYAEPGPGYLGGRFGGAGLGGWRGAGRRFAGRRFGGGRGGYRWRNWFHVTGLPFWARSGPEAGVPAGDAMADEAASLKAQAEWLRGELDAIDQRLQELDQQE
jgi:hypothetical protein